ncbi:MAG: hypothetical protein EOP45_17310 [Sphingobacteriaceae bacterium]|nr:MAG: hypothetical protein EOP45_17310 [Sphingobacteriaceae bacterium]
MKKITLVDTLLAVCGFGTLLSFLFGIPACISFESCDTELTASLISTKANKDRLSDCDLFVSYEWSGQNLTSYFVDDCPYNASAIDEVNICFSQRKPLDISPGRYSVISVQAGIIIYTFFYTFLIVTLLTFCLMMWVSLDPGNFWTKCLSRDRNDKKLSEDVELAHGMGPK